MAAIISLITHTRNSHCRHNAQQLQSTDWYTHWYSSL